MQVPVRQSVALNVQSDPIPNADSVGSCVLYIRAGQSDSGFGLIGSVNFVTVAVVTVAFVDELHIIFIVFQIAVNVFRVGSQIIIIIEITEFFVFFGIGRSIAFFDFVQPSHKFIKFVEIGVVIILALVGGAFTRFVIFQPLIVIIVVFRCRYAVHSGIARDLGSVYLGYPNVYPNGNNVIFVLFELVIVIGQISAAGNGVFGVIDQQCGAVFRIDVGQNFRSQRTAFPHVIEISHRGCYEFGIEFMIQIGILIRRIAVFRSVVTAFVRGIAFLVQQQLVQFRIIEYALRVVVVGGSAVCREVVFVVGAKTLFTRYESEVFGLAQLCGMEEFGGRSGAGRSVSPVCGEVRVGVYHTDGGHSASVGFFYGDAVVTLIVSEFVIVSVFFFVDYVVKSVRESFFGDLVQSDVIEKYRTFCKVRVDAVFEIRTVI